MMKTLSDRQLPTWDSKVQVRLHQQRSESGAAVVEGALIFGIFMSIILAIIEFGIFFMFWSGGHNAASETAHEISIAGKSSSADYSGLYASSTALKHLGGRVDYVIVYRAKTLKSTVPQACIEAAKAGKSDSNALKPYGVFVPPAGYVPPSGATLPTTVENFDWDGTPAETACNVYYPRSLAMPKSAFTYDLTTLAANPSLDRFWPGPKRRDSINGPVDCVGVYIQTDYVSTTGIVPTRKITHNAVIQIEPRRS
jgi:TadE-like protein